MLTRCTCSSYDTCDIGTLPNQTYVDGSGPPAALNTSVTNMALSYQPGQRLSCVLSRSLICSRSGESLTQVSSSQIVHVPRRQG